MPKVNNLSSGKASTPTAPAKSNPAPSAPSASNGSIQLKEDNVGAIAKQINVPAWLAQSSMPEISDREFGGFVGFASTFSEKWIEQSQAGLKDGQIYLYHNKQYIPLDKIEFFILHGVSYQTLMVGKAGTFKFATKDMSLSVDEMPKEGMNVSQQHYVMLVLVNVNGNLIPIKGDFRGTKSGGMESAIRAVEAAATPEWAQLSDRHRVACQFPQPYGRVYVTGTTSRQVSKTTGNPYYRLDCSPQPANLAQLQLLIEAFGDEEFRAALEEAKVNFDSRVKFLDEIVAKSSGTARPAN